tara:strand:- start:1228 stop:3072 length:1845 start_codon:yes stop_codon:yes gene_type:complete
MPLTRYTFKPGINKEGTSYSNEGNWFDADKIRFRAGRPEKIGGWVKKSVNTFLGSARKLHQWVGLDTDKFIALGTHLKLYLLKGNTFSDITPIRATTTNGVTFAATNGSSTITATDSNHGANKGDFVTFAQAVSLGGNITADVLNQEYEIAGVTDVNTFTFTAKDTSGNTVTANASDSGNGGSGVDGSYQINIGSDFYTSGFGFGSGTWGESTWGGGINSFATQLRLWTLDNFGEDLVANPRGGSIYYWDKTNGETTRAVDFSTLSGASDTPTIANQILVSEIDRHVICMGANPIGSATQDPMQIRWSDQENAAMWTPKTNNTAGGLRLSSGSEIIGAIRTRQEIAIFTDTALYSMQFIGPPFIFGVNLITEGISMVSPQACVNANNVVYFMDQDNFYMYSGTVQSLPCTVRAYVFDDFNYSQTFKVFATRNAQYNEVSWFYCSSSSDEIDRYVTYNYLEQTWTIGTLPRTSWIDAGGATTNPLAAGSSGTTSNYLYEHEVGSNDDGSAMTAYVESADFDAGDGDQFMFIKRLIPDVAFVGTDTAPELTYSIKTRDFPLGSLNTATTATVTNTTGVAYIRARARQMRVRIESTDVDNSWRLGDTRFDIKSDGRR